MTDSERRSTRRGQLRGGDEPWGGSLRMHSLSRHQNRRRSHSRQNCGATNRNRIQGRHAQVSGPCITKPFSSSREGKCGARARKVHVLIRGDLSDVPVSRACPKGGAVHAKATRCWAEVSRRHSTRLHTPLQRGRPERDAQVRAWLTSLRQAGSAAPEPLGG